MGKAERAKESSPEVRCAPGYSQFYLPLTSATEYLTIRILIESLCFSITGEWFLKSLYTFGNFFMPGIPVYIVIITPSSM